MAQGGFYHSLGYSTHFLGVQQKGNDPELNMTEPARTLAINERAPQEYSRDKVLNTELMKKLAGWTDDPVSTTGKYLDPSVWQPMCLELFCTQKPGAFPKDDGGVLSRLSYCFLPLTFVRNPTLDDERKQNPNIIEHMMTT